MKLIDRDKFINDMFDLYLDAGWNPQDVHFSLLDVRSNIDSPEYEVEAIPIEWLKSYVQKLETRLKDNLDLGEDGPTREIVAIEDMLDEWEKENEQDRSGI